MITKTSKPIRKFLIYGYIITLILSAVVTANRRSEDTENKQPHQPYIIIANQLRFALSGAPGEYREIEPVILKVHQNTKCIQFKADPFLYTGGSTKEKTALNVIYWVDKPQQCFDSKRPLLLYTGVSKKSERNDYFELRLYGKVTIDQISAQPAGEYEGGITVTVTEWL